MKIGIFYDSLLSNGGAEKVVVELANELGADIITAGYNPQFLTVQPINPVHDLGNILAKFSKPIGYLFEAPFRFFLLSNKYKYDINIFMGYSSIYGVQKSGNNLWYCLTPNRIIYDLRRQKTSQQHVLGKVIIRFYIILFSAWDKRCVARFPTIISQTLNVQKRVMKYYKRKSRVIFPPVPTSTFKSTSIGDYFLAVSRLFPEKRMSLIAEAFAGYA